MTPEDSREMARIVNGRKFADLPWQEQLRIRGEIYDGKIATPQQLLEAIEQAE